MENLINQPLGSDVNSSSQENPGSFNYYACCISSFKQIVMLCGMLLFFSVTSYAQKHMENINRGVVAVRTGSSVYVGWRMFGTDPASVAFNVYRGSTKLNSTPITNSTNYVDNTTANNSYSVRAVINGVEQASSESAGIWNQNYLQIPLQIPSGGYNANDCSVGDLDGDGQYEIVLKWDPTNSKDNSQSGVTGNVYLDAYKLNGTRLWRIDLGRNIRAGAHYTQFMVYDLDSDGKAEVACKTADGTRDGRGTVIGNASADYRNSGGYILTGPEFLTIFNGQTGAAMATTNYVPARGNVGGWGDTYGNRVDRFLAGIAYFDGTRPSLLMCRGYYTRTVLAAWDWRNGQLTQRWVFDTNTSGNGGYAGQGDHSLSIADVDDDGRDEVVYGSMVVDDNGRGLYNTGWGHGDALHVSDFDPNRAGLEVFNIQERPMDGEGANFRNARTGQAYFLKPSTSGTEGPGRGLAADVTAGHRGAEFWVAGGGISGMFNTTGQNVGSNPSSCNFAIWWDADPLRELLNSNRIDKVGGGNLLTAGGCTSNNGTKSTPALSADLFGDWREEVMFRTTDNAFLRIFTTTTPTTRRLYTLMHNPQYRVAIAWQNVAYNQPPHPSYFLGDGMATPPQPNIIMVGGTTPPDPGTGLTIEENSTGFCSVDGTIDNNNAGFTGAGFANANNAINAGVNWRINIPSSGSYTLKWRAANGSTADRTARLLVNGTQVGSNISFPSTGSWTTWNEVSATVTLNAGATSIRLESTTASGLSNIDYIQITGTNPTAVACSSGARIITSSILGNEALSAYPNPSNSSFLVKSEGNFSYIIRNQAGDVVAKGEAYDECTVGAGLKSGVYVLEVTSKETTKQIKLIKN